MGFLFCNGKTGKNYIVFFFLGLNKVHPPERENISEYFMG